MGKPNLVDNKKRALICVGQGEIDQDALSFTKDFVSAIDFHPVIFHVVSQGSSREKTDQLLMKVRDSIGIENAELRSIEGKLKVEIKKELKRDIYHVIILGTTERNPELPPSRLSQDIANRVSVSVLLLRNPPPKITEILVCTGGHTASSLVVMWGIKLAKATQENVTILHVVMRAPTMYTGLPAIEEDLSQVLSRDIPLTQHLKDAAIMAKEAGIKAKLELRRGLVTEEILWASEMLPYDLIVIGAPKPRSIFNRFFLGRVAPQLLASTHRSTLIIRESI